MAQGGAKVGQELMDQVQITTEELVNSVADEEASLAVRRYFTIAGRDPFDEIDWETRHAHIPGKDKPAFDQKDVEFPKFWSQTATNIVAQKYFRGRMSSPGARALRQADDRPRRRRPPAAGAARAATSRPRTRRRPSRTS